MDEDLRSSPSARSGAVYFLRTWSEADSDLGPSSYSSGPIHLCASWEQSRESSELNSAKPAKWHWEASSNLFLHLDAPTRMYSSTTSWSKRHEFRRNAALTLMHGDHSSPSFFLNQDVFERQPIQFSRSQSFHSYHQCHPWKEQPRQTHLQKSSLFEVDR